MKALATIVLLTLSLQVAAFELHRGDTLRMACDTTQFAPIVSQAIRMLQDDVKRVLGSEIILDEMGDFIVCLDSKTFGGQKEAFRLEVQANRLIVTGSDSHGVAYGLLEISRLIGVSPWEWWADASPKELASFSLPHGFRSEQTPDVEFRGIFINDEDWGMLPWATTTHEPTNVKGRIGPRTHERIFQLLLRLRANTFWPAMHECSEPFFLCNENRQMASRYGIYIGTSHCEPMACNVNGEWKVRGLGDYDYTTNSNQVKPFWEERVRNVAGQPIIYTLGMRGVHDGAMQGARTTEEQRNVLQQVIHDQRKMLKRHVNADLSHVPQVFIPYKEVLDVYNSGLSVPDDVCLMWCDDNYGYIRHFPNKEERRRKGGNGLYYHISYWGRPHDYLWLGTFSPNLLFQQMTTAFERGIQRMWILNVGDLKPAEYQIELFMDMAWDIARVKQAGVEGHLKQFLSREFGSKLGAPLTALLTEHYQLAFERKPEFLANTRTEERDPMWRTAKDLPWSMREIDQRMARYQLIEDQVEMMWKEVPKAQRDAFFQLVKYPLQAAAEMNKKWLFAQKARHHLADWSESHMAHDSIEALTRIYNRGKWKGIMSCCPRQLTVFKKAEEATGREHNEVSEFRVIKTFKAFQLTKHFSVSLDKCKGDSVEVEIRLLPTHAVEGDSLRFQLRMGRWKSPVTNFETYGRSEEWKDNVLRNYAMRRFVVPIRKNKENTLHFMALDEGVVVDKVLIKQK